MMRYKYRLMVPGPTPTPPQVTAAGVLPVIDERIPPFAELFAEVGKNLRYVFQTGGDVLVLTSSTTGALESVFQNTCSPGDRVLVVNNGAFGERLVDLARAYRLDVVEQRQPWGTPVDNDAVGRTLAADPAIGAAVCVHCETSTGVLSDVRRFGEVTRNVLSIVDAASSLGADDVRTDEWGLDVVVTGGQKALMTPPGVALVAVGARAWRATETARNPRFYFDWGRAKTAVETAGATPWTPAISTIMQLGAALSLIRDEGLAEVFARHRRLTLATRAGLRALGLRLFAADEVAASAVTTAVMPTGVDARELVTDLRERDGVQLVPGSLDHAATLLRVGHCGYMDGNDVLIALAALERGLRRAGQKVPLAAAMAAAQEVLEGR
jgi:aspartate aminotransferase-like enzyme